MKIKTKLYHFTFIIVVLFSFYCCKQSTNPVDASNKVSQVAIANNFIDAFYSFNSTELKSIIKDAENTKAEILYYQGWAKGGHYKILKRCPCEVKNDTVVVCPVTVKDDLIQALQLDLNVTDTFHITIKNKKITAVTTSSNDPPMFYEAEEWIRKNHPELIATPCKGIWYDGTTPSECVRAMVKGYSMYIKELKNNSSAIN